MRLHACAYVDSIATFNFKPNSKHLLLQWGADSLWREQVCESCSFSSTVSAATTCQLGFSYFCSSMQIRQTKSQISDHRQWLLIQDKHTHTGHLQTFFSRPACACLRVACDPSKPFYTPRCTRISNVPSSCLCCKWWIWSLLDTVLLSRVSFFRSRSSTWKGFHSVDATLRCCYRCCGISTQPWYRYCYPVVFTVWVSESYFTWKHQIAVISWCQLLHSVRFKCFGGNGWTLIISFFSSTWYNSYSFTTRAWWMDPKRAIH